MTIDAVVDFDPERVGLPDRVRGYADKSAAVRELEELSRSVSGRSDTRERDMGEFVRLEGFATHDGYLARIVEIDVEDASI